MTVTDIPLVSIIVPVYNREDTLEKCVNSLLKQTYSNIEIVLVNDASTDESLNISERLTHNFRQITVFTNETNSGASASRNVGIRRGSGEWLMFVDADDYIDCGYISSMMEHTKNTALVASSFLKVDCDENTEARHHGLSGHQLFDQKALCSYIDKYFYKPYEFTLLVHCWNKLFRKDILTSSGIFFNEGLNQLEDVDFVSRYLQVTKGLMFVDIPGYHHLVDEGLNNLSSVSGLGGSDASNKLVIALSSPGELKNQLLTLHNVREEWGYSHFVSSMAVLFGLRIARRFWRLKDFRLIIQLHRWLSSTSLKPHFPNYKHVDGESKLTCYCVRRLPAFLAVLAILRSTR